MQSEAPLTLTLSPLRCVFSVARPSRLRVYGASSPRPDPGDGTSPELAGEDACATLWSTTLSKYPLRAGKGKGDGTHFASLFGDPDSAPPKGSTRLHSRLRPVLALIVCLATAARAEDWPQFRGPRRDGHWTETGILESFPKDGLKIRW